MGDGPPQVLALHGWGRRGSDFAGSLEGLDAIAPDFPGFGASPQPESVMGASDYAETLLEVLDEYERPPLVVGHSFGGRVAVCLAAQHPDRVGPLVLTGVPLVRIKPTAKPKASFRIMRSLNEMGVVSDKRMEKLRDRSGSLEYRNAIGIMRQVFVKVVNESYEDQLASLKTPVRLLWGSEDKEVPVRVAERSLEILELASIDSMLEVLIGVGHHVPIEAPQKLRALIDRMNPS